MKLFLAILLLPLIVRAEARYIRPASLLTSANTGLTWADAWTNLAAVTWARNRTNFISGGNYVGNVVVSAALSGTNWVWLKKANAADNSSDPGWDTSFASSQATIQGDWQWWFGSMGMDGVTGAGTNGHGIKIHRTATSGGTVLIAEPDHSNFIVRCVELAGSGFAASSNIISGFRHVNNTAAQKSVVLERVWIHDVTINGVTLLNHIGTSFSDYGFQMVDSVVSETGGCLDPGNHGQGVQFTNGGDYDFCILDRNIFRNVVGSAAISLLGGTDTKNLRISNNAFFNTDNATYSTLSPGVIWSHDTGAAVSNIFILNNTFFNLTNASVRGRVVMDAPTIANVILKNNLFEQCYFPADHAGVTEQANNGYFVNFGASVPSGTSGQVDGASTAFVNSAAMNLNLLAGSYPVNAGVDLSADFTDDLSGATRDTTFDIGALEYIASPIGQNLAGGLRGLGFGF